MLSELAESTYFLAGRTASVFYVTRCMHIQYLWSEPISDSGAKRWELSIMLHISCIITSAYSSTTQKGKEAERDINGGAVHGTELAKSLFQL